MKHIAFLLARLWRCNAQAQNFPLDKAQVPTGYLYNLAEPLVEPWQHSSKSLSFHLLYPPKPFYPPEP